MYLIAVGKIISCQKHCYIFHGNDFNYLSITKIKITYLLKLRNVLHSIENYDIKIENLIMPLQCQDYAHIQFYKSMCT